MAKEQGFQDTNKILTNSFTKGLNKDSDPSFVTEGMWTHAINVVNNTSEGDVGTLSNETSNILCATVGRTMPITAVNKYIIGAIYLFSDKWIVFTAGHDVIGNRISSEIGLLEEDACRYREIVQDACLGFDKRYLISGASREKEDCTWQVYWADGLNPDRFLNVGDPKTWPTLNYVWVGLVPNMNYYSNGSNTTFLWPGVEWNIDPTIVNDCTYETNINSLNCDKIRLARLMTTPCLKLSLGQSGGTLANGTYFAIIAYTIKGKKVTDWFSQSNFQFIYTVNDLEGSLNLELETDNINFDEFNLVIVEATNQQTVATNMGIYSTQTTRLAFDQINPTFTKIPLEELPIRTPVFETSDQITNVNNYLLRIGPKSKFDFNYQPLANMIKTSWISTEYPADYYIKGGNKTNYLRDEVYTFYIRWIYDTGDKTSSYHIPGRAPRDFTIPGGPTVSETTQVNDRNALATDDKVFEIYNTATQTGYPTNIPNAVLNASGQWVLDDGGVVIAGGEMGYWESTEEYPDNRPDIWNPSEYCWTGSAAQIPPGQTEGVYDLCGKKIRHHKFPENYINNSTTQNALHFRPNNNSATVGDSFFIRLMGVNFENIICPKDQTGKDIPGIAGYEILRGAREGNKTIVAKGMVNNFKTYKLRGSVVKNRTGLYANYPYNTIQPIGFSTNTSDHNYNYNDPYIHNVTSGGSTVNQDMPTDIFTFHSPDTMFRTPFLSNTEFKLYGTLLGYADMNFIEPSGHPKFKLLSNGATMAIIIGGIAEAIISMIGKRTRTSPEISPYNEQMRGIGGAGPIRMSADTTGIGTFLSGTSTPGSGGIMQSSLAQNNALTQLYVDVGIYNSFINTYYSSGGALADVGLMLVGGYSLTAVSGAELALINAINAQANTTGIALNTISGSIELPDFAYLDPVTRVLGSLNQISFYFSQGANTTLKILYALTPFRQFALQQISHGYYGDMQKPSLTNLSRFSIEDSFYQRDNLQEVSSYQDYLGAYKSYVINNLKRSDNVFVRTKSGPYFNAAYPDGVTIGPNLITSGFQDKSLVTLGTIVQNTSDPAFLNTDLPDFSDKSKTKPFSLPIASHYGGLKVRVRNQYGFLGSEFQITITSCEQKLSDYNVVTTNWTCPVDNIVYTFRIINKSPIIFGGDTTINRYTEKNNMMYYFDWLYTQPDGFEYNYFLRNMIPATRFNVNSINYDVSFLSEAITVSSPSMPGTGAMPGSFYNMDYYVTNTRYYDYTNDTERGDVWGIPALNVFANTYRGMFTVKDAYFYLANSGVRDFFVESEVIVDFRKQSINDGGKHFDPYRFTNYELMFNMNPEVMGKLSEFIYDYSTSVSKLYNQYFSQGLLQSRYYDPTVAKLCFTYYPDRIIYSLPQQDRAVKDSWFIYLINNYKEFKGQISGVKAINKSGVIVTFKNESPMMFQGTDQLQTTLGTKLTIGDGGLFSQPVQSISNADQSYEYGSSQNRLSVISCPAGIFYISQNQGRIFSYGEQLTEISQAGLKWWFNLYLPYKLTEDFPDYPWQDNPVVGIGCQSTYDSSNSILYFSKKDYRLKDEFKDRVTYRPINSAGSEDDFILDGNKNLRFNLGDPYLFENASWTMSYDPKAQYWISFHNWTPDLLIPTKDIFLSTKNTGIWKHNYICDGFCNYYGNQFGWEVEFPVVTGQSVMTTRTIEYILECYRRNSINCIDQHHVLDYNFDTAVIHNTEQVTGYLNLNIYPKNDINLSLTFPKLNLSQNAYDILCSKEEQKYRFNQFWDITKNRDEFPIGSDYPPTGPLIPGTTTLLGNYSSQNTWITSPDGFTRILNPNNLDYNKNDFQRKKLRHYLNFVSLKKEQCNDVNMILKMSNSKTEFSPR